MKAIRVSLKGLTPVPTPLKIQRVRFIRHWEFRKCGIEYAVPVGGVVEIEPVKNGQVYFFVAEGKSVVVPEGAIEGFYSIIGESNER